MKKKIILAIELVLIIWLFRMCYNYGTFAGKGFFNIYKFFEEYGIWSIIYVVVCGFFEDCEDNKNLKKLNIWIRNIVFILASFVLALGYLYILKGSFNYQQLQLIGVMCIGMIIVRLITKVIKGIRSMW